jgi:hypothetical protein
MHVQPTLPSVFGTGDLVDDARMLREYAAKAADSIDTALDSLKTKPKVCSLQELTMPQWMRLSAAGTLSQIGLHCAEHWTVSQQEIFETITSTRNALQTSVLSL